MVLEEIINNIKAKKKRLDVFQPFPPEIISNLEDWFRVELTYTSNAIEGNTLSRQETSLVVEKGITVAGKSLKEHLEAINHVEALHIIKALSENPKREITENDILSLHQKILQKIDDANAGKYRNVSVRIAGSMVVLPNPLKVSDLMTEFVKWLKGCKENVISVAAEAHFRLVSIHPFVDGNGRTARLLMNLLLMRAGYPPAIIRKEDRLQYIQSLEKGQLSGKKEDYEKLIYASVDRSLDLYLETLEGKEIPQEKERLLKIGELAKRTSESTATIRHWTHEGLLDVQKKTEAGYQLYRIESVKRIQEIRKLQKEKRLTLPEIKKKFQKSL
ncbi:MAG: Fic family protein [bacterium]|nr:Fic family protein [bacterium]